MMGAASEQPAPRPSDARIAEIRARIDALPDGSWESTRYWRHRDDPFPVVILLKRLSITVEPYSKHDGDDWRERNLAISRFVAHSRDDVPWLLEQLDAALAPLAAAEGRERELREACIGLALTNLDDHILPTCLLCRVVGWARDEIVHRLDCPLAAAPPVQEQGDE